MGKRHRGNRRFRNRERNNDKNENNNKKDHNTAVPYDIIVKENKLFEKYYKETGIVPENEWDEFIECLKQPLPVTFRITKYKNYATEILNILKEKHFKVVDEYFAETQKEKEEGEAAELPSKATKIDEYYRCLTWYPDELGWQVNLSRQDVRKNEKFQKFKQFLIDQTESGNISRQEAVSMIPPLVADIKPHHKILDLCAAPGSKTAQLIEYLHSDENNPTPEGFVVANDIDNKRCYMLVHQLKRLESPNFMIINHDASVLPNFRYLTPEGQTRSIFYDRIICDVPCSGDGTFRKNVDVWKKWNFAHACNLFGIQFRIAQRAFELLAPNGLMVYSTCSLNPVENEAVVSNLLLKYKGQAEIIDARDKLPGLKTLNGFHKWKIMSKDGEIYENIKEINEKWQFLIREPMFPPSPEVAQELKLEKCIRVLPHHQNTGGFFIAVIRKTSANEASNKAPEAPAEPVPESEQAVVTISSSDSNSDDSSPPDPSNRGMKSAPAKRLKHVYDENPFRFCVDENQLDGWPLIADFFGIQNNFPLEQLMMRNRVGEKVRNVYFVSKNIHDLVQLNGDRIKFINMGVRLFSKAELKDCNAVELKVCQESIDLVYKYFTKRIMKVYERSDFLKLLSGPNPDIVDFTENLQNQIKECNGVGSIIISVYDKNTKYSNGVARSTPISFTGWIGKSTIRPFLNAQARKFLLTLCDIDEEEIEKICEAIRIQDQINTEKSKPNAQKNTITTTTANENQTEINNMT